MNGWKYRCVANNGTGGDGNHDVFSNVATLTVNASFVAVNDITGVPTTATAGIGLTLTGTVAPTNATNQVIIWSVQDAGGTGATIVETDNYPSLHATAAGTVTVKATITNGLTATTNFTKDFNITVATPVITITGQPAATTVTQGSISGKFLNVTASVTQGATLSYQWWRVLGAGSDVQVNGATSASFPIPANLTEGTYTYYCVVSAPGATSVKSNTATVTVAVAPVFTTHPADKTVAANQSATFTVAVTGTAPITYRWYYRTPGGVQSNIQDTAMNFSGQNTNTLTIINATTSYNGYEFYCYAFNVVSNGVRSNSAWLTVIK
jgi:hypothetical protein